MLFLSQKFHSLSRSEHLEFFNLKLYFYACNMYVFIYVSAHVYAGPCSYMIMEARQYPVCYSPLRQGL